MSQSGGDEASSYISILLFSSEYTSLRTNPTAQRLDRGSIHSNLSDTMSFTKCPLPYPAPHSCKFCARLVIDPYGQDELRTDPIGTHDCWWKDIAALLGMPPDDTGWMAVRDSIQHNFFLWKQEGCHLVTFKMTLAEFRDAARDWCILCQSQLADYNGLCSDRSLVGVVLSRDSCVVQFVAISRLPVSAPYPAVDIKMSTLHSGRKLNIVCNSGKA